MTTSLRSSSSRSLLFVVIVIVLLVSQPATSNASVKYYSRSDNWAGYGAPAPNGHRFSAVFAQYYQPNVSCKKNAPWQRVIMWAGLGGWDDSMPLVQVGTGVQCGGLNPIHFLWWDFVPFLEHDVLITDAPFVPAPGDYMTVQVQQWSPTSMFLSVRDTHGSVSLEWHKTVGAPAGSAGIATQSAECIVELPSRLSAKNAFWNLPNVGTTNFVGDCQAQVAETSTSYYLATDRKQVWSQSTFSPSELQTQAFQLRNGKNKLTPSQSENGFVVLQP